MTRFEAPIQDGPLENPEWTEEENRRYDALEDIETAATARRRALGSPARRTTDLEQIESLAAEIVRDSVAPKKSRRKRPINRPSRNFRIYDRDKNVEDTYGKPGEL